MRDANGESRADYLPVKTFKNRAENCAKYLSKGSKVAIEGPVQTYSYEAQDGSKRYGFEIVATEIMFLPSGNRSDAHNGGGQTAQQGSSQQYNGGSSSDGFTQVDDDELPF